MLALFTGETTTFVSNRDRTHLKHAAMKSNYSSRNTCWIASGRSNGRMHPARRANAGTERLELQDRLRTRMICRSCSSGHPTSDTVRAIKAARILTKPIPQSNDRRYRARHGSYELAAANEGAQFISCSVASLTAA